MPDDSHEARPETVRGFPLFESPIYRKVTELEVFGVRHILHPEELAARATGGFGVPLLHQAPKTRSDNVSGLQQMLRAGPSSMRPSAGTIAAGAPMPEFDLRGSSGTRLRKGDMDGRPFVVRLTRTMGSGVI